MDISNMLKYLRNKKGITQKELAEATKLSIHSIIAYENGKRSPTGKALAKFEDFFQVSGKYLMGEIEVETYGEDVEGWDHEATQMVTVLEGMGKLLMEGGMGRKSEAL